MVLCYKITHKYKEKSACLVRATVAHEWSVSYLECQNSILLIIPTVESLIESGLYLEFGIMEPDSIQVRTLFENFEFFKERNNKISWNFTSYETLLHTHTYSYDRTIHKSGVM